MCHRRSVLALQFAEVKYVFDLGIEEDLLLREELSPSLFGPLFSSREQTCCVAHQVKHVDDVNIFPVAVQHRCTQVAASY
jgi:hypothetical protein